MPYEFDEDREPHVIPKNETDDYIAMACAFVLIMAIWVTMIVIAAYGIRGILL